ncbi:GNAT family N-acetyltransferase [Streptomyces sp. M19]
MPSDNAPPVGELTVSVRPELSDAALNELFAAAWPDHEPIAFAPVLARSLVWIGAHRHTGPHPAPRLVGYVNVAGDGGAHAFVLDTTVHPDERRRGLGVRLVRAAAEEATRRGAEWLHVDYEPHLAPFYERCGFRPTAAGLLRL